MGRTLFLRALLLLCMMAGTGGGTGLARADSYAVELQSMSGVGDWDDLDAWLQQLCKVVQCSEERPPADGSISPGDFAALKFILAYEAYGVQPMVSKTDVVYAGFAAGQCLKILDEGRVKLDPDIEDALVEALVSLRIEMGS